MPANSKKKATAPPKTKSAATLWGFSAESLLLKQLQTERKADQKFARVHVQLSKKPGSAVRVVEGGDHVDIFLAPLTSSEAEHDPRLKTSPAVRVRDAVGSCIGQLEKMEVGWAEFDFNLDPVSLDAAILGLEIALYRYKRVLKGEASKLGISLKNKGKAVPDKVIAQAAASGVAVNLARHMVNLPPNLLNPVTYADAVQSWFGGQKNVKVEVWNEARLAKENLNLLLGVGQGSATPPRLVHIRYRPTATAKNPIAFIGKGITFDTGGLDIKPSSGMRLMKKDMGGSAAIFGLAHWASQAQPRMALDFYLPIAENAVSGGSFRPSDVIVARNGLSVEIHNTDAEGRLVLADAIDVAATQADKPRMLVDVATLTGAIKVALGAHLAGCFSTDPRMAQAIAAAGQQVGDLAWVMPLFQRYRSQMTSHFADMVNAVDGFGGAVTAALFLEKFTRDIPWAHLDIYGWKDSTEGPWLESGGSGQAILGLAQWLRTQKA